jgi:hypothetical protein
VSKLRTDPEPTVPDENGKPVVPSHSIGPTYLRPTVGALWDTDTAVDRRSEGLQFFQRALSMPFQYVAGSKSRVDTNMCMVASLPMPCQFLLFGISLKVLDSGPAKDVAAVKSGLLEFVFCGNRVYFERPIDEIPDTMDAKQDWLDLADRASGEKPSVDECYKRAIKYFANIQAPPLRTLLEGGKSSPGYAITILPQECFGVRLSWPNGLALSQPTRIRTSLWGVYYQPV